VYDFCQRRSNGISAQALILHGFSGELAMRKVLNKLTGICLAGCVALLAGSAIMSQSAPPASSTPPANAPAAGQSAGGQAAGGQAAAAQPADEWPDGPGKAIFLQTCSNCHSPENVLGHNLDSDGWTDLLNRMIQFGAQGSDEDFGAILQYLVTNFGPVPAKANINKVTAMNLRNWYGMSQKDAEAIVAYRAKNGDFKSLDDVKKVPGIDTKFLDSIKDSLVYQ
jgi:competence protein ComEA